MDDKTSDDAEILVQGYYERYQCKARNRFGVSLSDFMFVKKAGGHHIS